MLLQMHCMQASCSGPAGVAIVVGEMTGKERRYEKGKNRRSRRFADGSVWSAAKRLTYSDVACMLLLDGESRNNRASGGI